MVNDGLDIVFMLLKTWKLHELIPGFTISLHSDQKNATGI